MKDQLTAANHAQTRSIQQRHMEVIRRWDKLQKDSESHRARLQRSLEQFKKVCIKNRLTKWNSLMANSSIHQGILDPTKTWKEKH